MKVDIHLTFKGIMHWSKADFRIEEVPLTKNEMDWNHYQPTEAEISSAYDFFDVAVESDFAPNPRAKRRCAEDTPLSPMDGLTSRFGTRVPSLSRSLSRKWRSRKTSPVTGITDRSQDPAPSGTNSRRPSVSGSVAAPGEVRGTQHPPTPRRSLTEDRFEDAYHALVHKDSIDAAQDDDDVVDRQAKPTTPLLPPILTQLPSDIREVPYQSPLQSPSVADPEAPSVHHTPLPTPRIAGLPSPPLSSKPSISSFHRQRGPNPVAPVSPSSEIPPMMISDPKDRWTDQLGHANFTIFPEPYIAADTTLVACKQLRTDWETAQSKYLEHRARIGDNYGLTSKIYLLTEEKWSEINSTWKRNVELSFSRIPKLNQGNEVTTSIPSQDQSDATPEPHSAPLVKTISPTSPTVHSPKNDAKFPSLSESKFPTVGEEGIVGPMEVVPPLEPQRPRKRKLGFFRWVQGVWPAGAGAGLIRRSSAVH